MATYLDGMDGGKHNSDGVEVKPNVKTFSVSLNFTDIVAENPLEAAKIICGWLLEDNGAEDMIYDVTDENTNESFSVDLGEDDEDAVLPY